MTQAKACKEMLNYARYVLDPNFAKEIAKAFGYSLKELGLQPQKTKTFHRLNYAADTAELPSVSCYQLARAIAEKQTGEEITSGMHGMGSMAQDITEKSLALLAPKRYAR